MGLKKAKKPILMCTNAGDRKSDMKAKILGMDHKCWVDKELMANVIAFFFSGRSIVIVPILPSREYLMCSLITVLTIVLTVKPICNRWSRGHEFVPRTQEH